MTGRSITPQASSPSRAHRRLETQRCFTFALHLDRHTVFLAVSTLSTGAAAGLQHAPLGPRDSGASSCLDNDSFPIHLGSWRLRVGGLKEPIMPVSPQGGAQASRCLKRGKAMLGLLFQTAARCCACSCVRDAWLSSNPDSRPRPSTRAPRVTVPGALCALVYLLVGRG